VPRGEYGKLVVVGVKERVLRGEYSKLIEMISAKYPLCRIKHLTGVRSEQAAALDTKALYSAWEQRNEYASLDSQPRFKTRLFSLFLPHYFSSLLMQLSIV
jgi:hypothetical protein